MSLRTTLQNLIRRDSAASLRERAAELRASISTPKPQVEAAADPTPALDAAPDPRDAELLALQPEWEARAAAYTRAIEEQGTITDNAPNVEAPPPFEPIAEWSRLLPGWRQRTGVEDAEFATADAMDDICEIENRISNMHARTLAGLKLKARVAQRNEDVSWPEGLEESLVRDILAIGEPEIEADAELLRLGRQFEAACAHELAACHACNMAQREANRLMPERPAALFYRASDERLNVFRHLTDPESLNGVEISSADVERLRRIVPMTHEVLRPIRDDERAHMDHPGRKFDIVPHREAQARAEEILAAWDAWLAEQARIQDQYVTPELDDAAEAAGEATASLAEQISQLPAKTAAGFRVKLRSLLHYRTKTLLPDLPEEPDPDQILSHSLWHDVQGMLPEPTPASVLTNAILDLWREWAADERAEVYSQALQDRRFSLIRAADELPATIETIGVKALAISWLEYVDHWRPGAARSEYTTDGRLAVDIHAAITNQSSAAVPASPHEPSLVSMLDLASATMGELQAIRDVAERVGSVAYTHAWSPRCQRRAHPSGASNFNAAGKLVQWVGDALTAVESAAEKEAQRRTPTDRDDRETRLSMLAVTTIDNGDPDETEAFARELLAHVEAERAGR